MGREIRQRRRSRPKANVHIQGLPTGAALALKMRPTRAPSASTSKSSSFHPPQGREADARFRTSPGTTALKLLLFSDQKPTALVSVQVKQLDGYNLGPLAIGRFNRAEIFAFAAHDDDAPALQIGGGGPLSLRGGTQHGQLGCYPICYPTRWDAPGQDLTQGEARGSFRPV